MYNNVLPETVFTQQIHEEYLRLIRKYQNLSRPSIFCRYLNINVNESSYNTNNEASFDHYNSGIRYDIYDYTPFFYTSQIINDTVDQPDLIGQMFHASATAVFYTIKDIRVEDLVIFPYTPQLETEIFRVTNSRIAINAKISTIPTNWYEVTLEYAPIIDYKKLNLLNQYTYVLPFEKYIFTSDFTRMIKETEKMATLFDELQNQFDPETELYYLFTSDGQKIAPLDKNKIIYNFLANYDSYQEFFAKPNRPFGIKTYGDQGFLNVDTRQLIEVTNPMLNDIEVDHLEFDIVQEDFIFIDDTTAIESILSYNGDINIYDMVELINIWIWYKDRNIDDYPEPKITVDNFHSTYDEELEEVIIHDYNKFDVHRQLRRRVVQPYRTEPGS